METKENRLKELEEEKLRIEREIQKVNGEPQDNFALIKVVPDCGGGIKDDETILAVSEDQDSLVKYCEENHSYSPALSDERPKDGSKPCDTWYKLEITKIQLI